jgi:hypothetical protein
MYARIIMSIIKECCINKIEEHLLGAKPSLTVSVPKINIHNLGKATETNWLILRGGRVVSSEERL